MTSTAARAQGRSGARAPGGVARVVVGLVAAAGLLAWPRPARADLVRFPTGRIMSVRSARIEGATAVLVLRDGGRVELPASEISAILPDEYVHPTPAAATAPATVAAPSEARGADLGTLIDRLAQAHGVDAKLAHAVIRVESNYEPRAVSPKGAMGLMQIMPTVAQQYAVDDPFDPEKNLNAGLSYLRDLLDRFDLRTALAAYNAGPAAVARYGGVPPFRETQEYVAHVLALVRR